MNKLIGIVGLAGSGKDTACALLLEHLPDHYRYAFADPLKLFTMSVFGLTDGQCYDNELKEKEINFRIPEHILFDRYLKRTSALISKLNDDNAAKRFNTAIENLPNFIKTLQSEIVTESTIKRWFYTQMMGGNYLKFSTTPRKLLQLLGTEFFRECINRDVWTTIAPKHNIIVPDVRFANEVDHIKNSGGYIIKIVNPELKQISTTNHVSEDLARNLSEFDFLIENNKSQGMAQLAQQISVIAENMKSGYGQK
jgi:hypothetical protein